jgi:membrane-associated phospholipid phosphatase
VSADPPKPARSSFARAHPRAFLSAYTAIGLALAAASAWTFFLIADEFPERGWLSRFDLTVTNWLQAHGTETGRSIFVGVSYFGGPGLSALLLAAAIIMAWRRNVTGLVALAVTCGGAMLLNSTLKIVFHRARPSFVAEFPVGVSAWSFPSAHAMNSLVTYGFLAAWLIGHRPAWRNPVLGLTAVIVLAIGLARIYLRVHYLSDVLAGYTAGLVWLVVCTRTLRFVRERQLADPVSAE